MDEISADRDASYIEARRNAEYYLDVHNSIAVAAWETAAIDIGGHATGLRENGILAIGLAENLKIYFAMEMGAYVDWVLAEHAPGPEAIRMVREHAKQLAEDVRDLKWLPVLRAYDLDGDKLWPGWDVPFRSLLELDLQPTFAEIEQEAIDVVLSHEVEDGSAGEATEREGGSIQSAAASRLMSAADVNPTGKYSGKSENAKRVERFLVEASEILEQRLTKTDFWMTATPQNEDRSVYQAWQRGNHSKCGKGSAQAFELLLKRGPQAFADLFRKRQKK